MRFFAAVLLLWAITVCEAAQVEIRSVRIQEQPFGTQVIFETNGIAEHHSFMLEHPPRLVVDVKTAQLQSEFNRSGGYSPDVIGVRTSIRRGNELRIVLDLPTLVHNEIYMLQTPRDGHVLVVDLFRKQRPNPANILPTVSAAPERSVDQAPVPDGLRSKPLVIAIDPGHGGKDTGAIGPHNVREKDVVLKIAKRLQRLVNREPGMRAVLTRKDDSYLRLYERIEIARKHQADLFISLHADACEDCQASGSSVFMLSTQGATSAAAHWLAKRENESDLIGGRNLANVHEELVPVVFDVVQDGVLSDSMRLAERVLEQLEDVGDVHKGHVERAGFAVLKAPDMPSILVETAFISNPREESKLTDSRYQEKLAQAVLRGVNAYIKPRPAREQMITKTKQVTQPAASPRPVARLKVNNAVRLVSSDPNFKPLSPRVHVIRRGESLAEIAEHYRISLATLRSINGLNDNQLRMPAGTPLTLPKSDS